MTRSELETIARRWGEWDIGDLRDDQE